jgi:hypothetical protein
MKRNILYAVTLAASLLTLGCASSSYQGRYAPGTPAKERCLLEFPPTVYANFFDGKKVSWGGLGAFKTIPAGTHTVVFSYNRTSVTTTGYNTYTQTTYTANGMEVTYEFEAGKHYVVSTATEKKDDRTYVIIVLNDETAKSKVFHGGTYSNFDGHISYYLATTSTSAFSIGFNGPSGYVHDGVVRWGLYLDKGIDLGVTYPLGMSAGVYAGVLGQFFIPATNIGLGVGAGYRGEIFMPFSGQGGGGDMLYYPYARAALFPPFNNNEWHFYFDYNFDYQALFSALHSSRIKPPQNWSFEIPKKWGAGLSFNLK